MQACPAFEHCRFPGSGMRTLWFCLAVLYKLSDDRLSASGVKGTGH
jgi:hypothetical protein